MKADKQLNITTAIRAGMYGQETGGCSLAPSVPTFSAEDLAAMGFRFGVYGDQKKDTGKTA